VSKTISSWKRVPRPEIAFLVFYTVTSVLLALLLPAGCGLDEPQHIARVDQIARGQLLSVPVRSTNGTSLEEADSKDILYGGDVDKALVDLASASVQKYQGTKKKFAFPAWRDDYAASVGSYGDADKSDAFSNTSVYSPIAYLPQALGLRLGLLFTHNAYALTIACRMGAIAFLAVALYLCIRRIPIGKWALVWLGLLPNVLVTNACVNADTVTLGVCVCMVTALLRVASPNKIDQRIDWVCLAVASLLLGLVKMSYLPLLGLYLLIPFMREDFRDFKAILRLALIVVASIAAFLLWYLQIKDINTGAMWNSPGIDPAAQLTFVLAHPLHFCRLLLNALLSDDVLNILGGNVASRARANAGFFVRPNWWLLIGALALCVTLNDDREAFKLDSGRKLVSFVATCVVFFLLVHMLVNTALYLQYTPVGKSPIDGVQARYFLPAELVLLLPFVAIAQARKASALAEGAKAYASIAKDSATETDTPMVTSQAPRAKRAYEQAGIAPWVLCVLYLVVCTLQLYVAFFNTFR